MAKLTEEQKQDKVLSCIRKAKKALSANEVVDQTGLSPEDVRVAGKALIALKKVRFTADRKKLEAVPSAKDAAPVAKASTKKAAAKNDDWDDDDEDDDEDDEDESDEDDEDEDDGDTDEDEDESDEDEDEDDDDDDDGDSDDEDEDEDEDEDDDPPAKSKKSGKLPRPSSSSKSSKSSKAPAPKAKAKSSDKSSDAPAKVFTMSYQPIDTLDDKELKVRIRKGLEAAESLVDDGHKVVAELIMREIPRLKKQLAKRTGK